MKMEDDTETIQNFRAWAKEVVRRQALLAIRKREKSSKLTRAVSPELLDVVSTAFIEDDSTRWQESGKGSQVEENRARACPDLQDSIADRFEKK
jgi:DNA-directed RNA polymerase specialized sigma24 family protein